MKLVEIKIALSPKVFLIKLINQKHEFETRLF